MTATISPPTTTDPSTILADYEEVALPALARLADVAEEVRDVLATTTIRQLPSHPDGARLAREATELRIAIRGAEERGVNALDKWMVAAEAEADRAKAIDPDPAVTLARLAESMTLSSLDAKVLAAEARVHIAQGDGRAAEVRFNAAKLAGTLHPGVLRALKVEVDAALDEEVPHRKAAAAAAHQARVARYVTQLAMMEVGRLVRELGHADPAQPEREVAAIRDRLAGAAS